MQIQINMYASPTICSPLGFGFLLDEFSRFLKTLGVGGNVHSVKKAIINSRARRTLRTRLKIRVYPLLKPTTSAPSEAEHGSLRPACPARTPRLSQMRKYAFRRAFATKRASPASVYLWTKSLCVCIRYIQRD